MSLHSNKGWTLSCTKDEPKKQNSLQALCFHRDIENKRCKQPRKKQGWPVPLSLFKHKLHPSSWHYRPLPAAHLPYPGYHAHIISNARGRFKKGSCSPSASLGWARQRAQAPGRHQRVFISSRQQCNNTKAKNETLRTHTHTHRHTGKIAINYDS